MSAVRLSKIILVAAIAFYMSLIALNNLIDYQSNFAFVVHVLDMDTVPAASTLHWRALPNEYVHHVFCWTIIVWELLTALLCWWGTLRLSRSLRSDGMRFQQAKVLAQCGLVVGIMLWLVAFLCIGGEWFVMWQSPHWNGQDAAFRMFTVTGVVLLYLMQPEPD